MATIYQRERSKFWYCQIRVVDSRGRTKRVRQCTGTTDEVEAQEFADNLERQLKKVTGWPDNVSEAIVRKWKSVTLDLLLEALGVNPSLLTEDESIKAEEARKVAKDWLSTKRSTRSEATWRSCKTQWGWFLEAHPRMKFFDDLDLTKAQALYEKRLELTSVGTSKKFRVHMHSLWEYAIKRGQAKTNVWKSVEMTTKKTEEYREPITASDFKAILAHIEAVEELENRDEWVRLAYLGRYSGGAIGDCLKMGANSFVARGEFTFIKYQRKKTDKPSFAPVLPILQDVLSEIESGLFCPYLSSIKTHRVSTKFRKLVEGSGIDYKVVKQAGGRTTISKTFHCLRHGLRTELMDLGMSRHLANEILGHEGKSAEGYEHADIKNAMAFYEDLD